MNLRRVGITWLSFALARSWGKLIPQRATLDKPANTRSDGGQLTGSIKLDGMLDEPAWASASPVTSFTQYDPTEGAPASEKTEVRVLVGADALYIGAKLYESNPANIVRVFLDATSRSTATCSRSLSIQGTTTVDRVLTRVRWSCLESRVTANTSPSTGSSRRERRGRMFADWTRTLGAYVECISTDEHSDLPSFPTPARLPWIVLGKRCHGDALAQAGSSSIHRA